MPGVPSGRGCEACRKQKKKCDQKKPHCGRCTRLEIDCVGSGQRRFKFVDESPSQLALVKPKSPTQSPQKEITAYERISWLPSSDSSMMIGAFCSALEVTDVRYDLGVYGTFMRDIPRRIGSSVALDASIRAVTSTYSSLQTRSKTVDALECYVDGLEVLRKTLCAHDPSQTMSANNLCAMYLMMVCHGWMGEKNDCTSHGEVFAYMLSKVNPEKFQESFEDELILTLCVPVIVESIARPSIQLHPWLERLTTVRDDACPMQSLKLKNLGKISDFIVDPEGHLVEMYFIYQSMEADLARIRTYLATLENSDSTAHSRYITIYGIQLSFAMILNMLLRSFSVDNFMQMLVECTALVSETITVAEKARQYRPLGSSCTPMTLTCAMATTTDSTQKQRAGELLDEYQEDFEIADWRKVAIWLEKKLSDACIGRCLEELAALGGKLEISGHKAVFEPQPSECCVM
ncbi:hypothetical protein VTL71DRAFT_6319 [Oculimacula yallundae]|uniref:Zn(2)-C6 fungal-type domain-containing protein n=1 Tax=Oculimacula yallundae TaxID=86028 RepID=A0ABR4BWN0_9HELO